MFEADEPRPRQGFAPPAIDRWGVDDLRAYIADLRTKIARAEAEIGKRDAHRSAADAFFKTPQ